MNALEGWTLREATVEAGEPNPAGERGLVALDDRGREAARLSGVPLRMRVGSEEVVWTRVPDPDLAPFATASRPFGRGEALDALGVAFAERWYGAAPAKDPLLFALPSAEAHGDLVRMLELEVVRDQLRLVLDPGRLRAGSAGSVTVEARAEAPAGAHELFARAAPASGAMAVRDARFYAWRFGANARHAVRVRFGVARRGGELAGLAVLSRARLAGEECDLIADWLVPAGDDEARAALLAWGVAENSKGDGARPLATLLPDTSPHWLPFQRAGFRVRPLRAFLCMRSFPRPIDMHWVAAHWQYTPADLGLG
jgi:hypothetical protein